MQAVTIYTTRLCGFCHAAKNLLDKKRVAFEEIPVDGNSGMRAELMQRSGQRTVPQVWIGDQHIGGYTDLAALDKAGQLDKLLA